MRSLLLPMSLPVLRQERLVRLVSKTLRSKRERPRRTTGPITCMRHTRPSSVMLLCITFRLPSSASTPRHLLSRTATVSPLLTPRSGSGLCLQITKSHRYNGIASMTLSACQAYSRVRRCIRPMPHTFRFGSRWVHVSPELPPILGWARQDGADRRCLGTDLDTGAFPAHVFDIQAAPGCIHPLGNPPSNTARRNVRLPRLLLEVRICTMIATWGLAVLTMRQNTDHV